MNPLPVVSVDLCHACAKPLRELTAAGMPLTPALPTRKRFRKTHLPAQQQPTDAPRIDFKAP